MPTSWSKELGACARLAAPIAMAQIAQVTMQLVDTAVVTPLGAGSIGAVGLGNTLFAVVWPLVGILLCLDTETSQAVGRDDRSAATKTFAQAMFLLAGITLCGTLLLGTIVLSLPYLGVNPDIVPLTQRYLLATTPAILPLAFSFASTKFLQAHGSTTPALLINIGANVLNFFLSTGLVHGRWGLPALGVVGAGIGTSICRWSMALAHLIVIVRLYSSSFQRRHFVPDRAAITGLLRLGVPAGLQMGLEIGIFVLATALIARFDATTLAAHHLLLQLATFTFMLPMGIAGAAAVRVGHAIGAGDGPAASHRGTVAIAFAAAVMAAMGVMMMMVGAKLTELVAAPPEVTAAFTALVGFAAAFQVFDGVQVTATGALRGLGQTRSPFFANLIGHWLFAFPLMLFLGFSRDLRAAGIWLALTIGLIVTALALLWVWRSHTVRLGERWMPQNSSAEISSSPSSTATS